MENAFYDMAYVFGENRFTTMGMTYNTQAKASNGRFLSEYALIKTSIFQSLCQKYRIIAIMQNNI